MVFITSDLYYVKGFLSRQIKACATNYETYLVVNSDIQSVANVIGDSVTIVNLDIRRKISVLRDIYSLVLLIIFLFRVRPDIVHSTTPKAGFMAMMASFLTSTPIRIHTFTGQVWQTKTGAFRVLLKFMDKLTAKAATFILCDSHGQREFLLTENVLDPVKSSVLHRGSICGVDCERFRPSEDFRQQIRSKLGLEENEILVLYMARFTRDKGALLMADAINELLKNQNIKIHLLMIGPDEEGLINEINSKLFKFSKSFTIINYTDTPEIYFSAADLFCLPSYREGFPMVLLNASASGIPVVASRIYGTSDAVLDGETGLLFEPGNLEDLVEKLSLLICSQNLRKLYGLSARNFALNNFSESLITRSLLNLYERNLAAIPSKLLS